MDRGQTQVSKKIGFTIVELIVVIVVIGILTSVAIVSYTYLRKDATESRIKANLGQVNSYLVAYRSLNQGLYPAVSGGKPADVPDIDRVVSDSEIPVIAYKVSPSRKKFCIEVLSTKYSDLRFVAKDSAGKGVPVVEEGFCPSALPD